MSTLNRRALLLSVPAASVLALGTPLAAQATTPHATPKFGFIGGQISPSWSKKNAKRELDEMAAVGSRVARITFSSELILSDWNGPWEEVTPNPEGIQEIHEVLDHAKALGMDLWLNMNGGYHDQSAPDDVWLHKSRSWWDTTAQHFASKADVLQVFNEATGWHYRYYREPENPEAYLIELRDLIQLCGDTFKRYNPNVKVTHNLFGYPVSDWIEETAWIPALDVIHPALDLISIDTYFPETLHDGELEQFDSDRLARLEERYEKPTAIAEIGMSTMLQAPRYELQREYYQRCIEVLSNSRAEYIVFYSYRDPGTPTHGMSNGELSEASFGVVQTDGTRKPAGEYLHANPFPG